MKAALLALVLALLPGRARGAGDLRACLPLPGGRTAVGGDGGLVLLDAAGARPGPALTARAGLPDTRVLSLALVGGVLVVGTEAGVARLPLAELGRGRPIRALRSAPVRAIIPDGSELLLGTFDGVKRLTASGVLAPVPFLEEAPAELEAARRRVTALARYQGAIVVGTGAGLYRLEGKGIAAGLRRIAAALPSEQVFALHARADGALLVGTLLGLASLGARPPLLSTPSPDLRAIAGDRERLLLGSFGEGLFAGPAAGRRLVASEPAAARHLVALALAESGAGCLVAREGLWLRVSARSEWRRVELGGLPSSDLSALAVDGGALWLGTFDRGLFRLERRTGALTAFPGIEPQVNALAVEAGAGARTVWVGTSRGLYALDGSGVRRVGRGAGLPSEDIHALAPTRRGLLVGTGRGAALLRDGKVVEVVGQKRGLVISAVWAVAEADDGALWLGTSKGVFRGRFRGAWKRFSVASGHLTDDWVTALATRAGSVWVGSYSGGVTRLDTSGAALSATVIDRESWVNFAGLSLVDGSLLVATMDGLRRCPLGAGACQALGATLPGRDVTAAASDGTTLWVATRRGLGSLTPSDLR